VIIRNGEPARFSELVPGQYTMCIVPYTTIATWLKVSHLACHATATTHARIALARRPGTVEQDHRRVEAIDEINVTPLIDVLLVLLIIFLVMIPVMARIHVVELPPKETDSQPTEPPVIVKLHGDLSIAIDDGPLVSSTEIASIRTRALGAKTVFVDAESTVPWTEVVAIVDRIRGLDRRPIPSGLQSDRRPRTVTP
jgi:biopolymer transport protein ExbD